MVAVSVGMLDTGFDCREVLHLVMCRRVRSPILYQQMRGRGTRTAPHIGKQKFVIYDFFGNHEYFNDSDTDIFTGTGGGHAPQGRASAAKIRPASSSNLASKTSGSTPCTYVEVGPRASASTSATTSPTGRRRSGMRLKRDPIIAEDARRRAADRARKSKLWPNA